MNLKISKMKNLEEKIEKIVELKNKIKVIKSDIESLKKDICISCYSSITKPPQKLLKKWNDELLREKESELSFYYAQLNILVK
jgi:hypothetical protein